MPRAENESFREYEDRKHRLTLRRAQIVEAITSNVETPEMIGELREIDNKLSCPTSYGEQVEVEEVSGKLPLFDSLLNKYSHRGCSFILPKPPNLLAHPLTPNWLTERTHACWCSVWQLTDGEWKVWKDGVWTTPPNGDVWKVKQKHYPESFDDKGMK